MARMINGAKGNVLVLAHRHTLINQHKELLESLGVLTDKVRVESVFTEASRLGRYEKDSVSLIIIDEAHLSEAASYKKVCKYYDCRRVLFTATPARLDGKPLTLADTLIEGVTADELIKMGAISEYDYYAPDLNINTDNVDMVAGEYNNTQLTDLMCQSAIYGDVLKYYQLLGENRQAIAYCTSVKHSIKTADMFINNGISAVSIDGSMNMRERNKRMDMFRKGKVQILCNCNLISEGVTLPNASVALLLRPTMSLPLFIQQACRVLTPVEGKKAVIIDYVNNVQRHGLPTDTHNWSLTENVEKRKEFNSDGTLSIRQCENCFKCFRTAQKCPYCGYEYTVKGRELKAVKDELKTTQYRIDELEAKDKLSFVEKEELQKLKEQNAELLRQEKILEAQEARARKKQLEAAMKAKETDVNLKGSYSVEGQTSSGVPYTAAQQAQTVFTKLDTEGTNNYESALAGLKSAKDSLNKAQEALATTTYDAESKEYKKLENAVSEAEKRVEYFDNTLSTYHSTWAQEYGEIGYIENATTSLEKEWNEFYNQMQDYKDQQALLNGDLLKSDVMSRVFGSTGTEEAQNFKEAFDAEIQAGRSPDVAIANVLENAKFSSFTDTLLSKFGINKDEIIGFFTQIGEGIITELNSVDTYSVVAESVTNYNEVLKQTSELIVDNTQVTQEYKNSLLALGVSESELNECFDENNKLVVKDADALNKLVKSTKNNVAQNVKLAKTQAQLQYQSLANKMRVNVAWMAAEAGSYSIVSQAVEENISMLEEQMEAIDQLIQKYALLELSMTNAGKAYTNFELAKERDSELTYDESFLEMLKTIDEGLLKNETGTEAFEYAVKAVLSPEAYADMEALDDVNEKVKFIHDYVDGDPILSRWFYVDEESGEFDITADNVRAFVNDGLTKNKEGKSVFTGDATNFELSDDVNGIEDVAEILGVSEAAALAMLTALEKVDAKWGDILTEVSMTAEERKIHSATKEVAELNKQLAEGKITAEEYAEKVAVPEQQIESFVQTTKDKLLGSDGGTEDTSDDTLGFIELDKQAADAQKEVEKSTKELVEAQKELNEAKSNGADGSELQSYQDKVDKATKKVGEHTEAWKQLIEKRGEYPSEYEIQFVINDINQEIEAYGTKFDKVLKENFKKDSDGYYVPISAEVNIDELENTYPGIKNYINLLNSKTKIEAFANTTSAEEDAQKLKETVGKIIEAIEANLITLELDDEAANNIVTQANKILSGIISTLGVNIVASMPSWMQSILGFMGFDVGNKDQTVIPSSSTTEELRNLGYGYALGNAYASGNIGLSQSEHNSVVGELGPEMVVDPVKGIYYTVGNNGTEMVNLPKGAIIYNHKQTEELLKNGRTSRGKSTGGLAWARGNAYATHGIPSYHPNLEDKTSFANSTAVNTKWDDSIRDLSNAADNIAEAAEDFEEVFDWVEVRLEEIEEQLNLLNAQLENAVGYIAKNQIIDATLNVNDVKLSNLKSGLAEYERYTSALLSKVPASYRDAAQNGAIAIEEFTGEADEKTIEAINNYREWAQKVADTKQQIEELKTEISDLSKQKFDNVVNQFENEISLIEAANDKLDAQISLMEDRGYIASKEYYEAMAENTTDRQKALEKELSTLQAVLDEEVKAGRIEVGSDAWYEMVQQLYDVDAAIVECTSDLESFQNAINDIYWDNLDELINRYDYLADETQNLIDLMDRGDKVTKPDNEKGWIADEVKWTDEGIASLGLYAQQMEIAEAKARQYAQAIDDLNKDYKDGKYSESEYYEKLNELKNEQYDAIESYHDAQDAIKDLNEEMVDAVKDGIEKQIEAYEELIDKQKELLDSEKDLYDFEKSVSKQQKNIADIERQLAAIANDTSITAMAKRKKLEAELAEAQAELQDMYYDRSVEDKKEALDKEAETFKEAKEKEIEEWEKYLEDVAKVVADSLILVQENATGVYNTLSGKAEEYNLTLSDAVISPWTQSEYAISSYQTVFDTAASATTDRLNEIKLAWQEVIDKMSAQTKPRSRA